MGTFARLLGQRGAKVLVLDSDPMPGLADALGVERSDAGLAESLMVERAEGEQGPRFRFREDATIEGILDASARAAPDGVRLLQLGKMHGTAGELQASQFAYRAVAHDLPEDLEVIADLPGGTRQAFFGWGDFADTLVVVVEATAASMLSARRLARLGTTDGGPHVVAVANRVRADGDAERIATSTGLEVVGEVPWDDQVAAVERRGQAPVDACPGAPAVAAISSLVTRLTSYGAEHDVERRHAG